MVKGNSAWLPSRRSFRRHALSLVEVLVGVALLGGAALIVLGLFPTAYNSLIQARDTTAATNLARQVLERSRAAQFNHLVNITNAPCDVTSSVNGEQIVTHFAYDLQLKDSDPTPGLYYEAAVTIHWTSGANHVIRLDTVIPNR